MTFERLSNPSSVELKSGSTTIFIEDVTNLESTVASADERTQLAGHWFNESEQQHLLESAVWLERINDSERVLHGQILFDPLTHFDQPDATLVTLHMYLMTVMGYDSRASAFEMDTDERWVLALGDTGESAMFIRIEAIPADSEDNIRAAHQVNISMNMTGLLGSDSSEHAILDFFKLWGMIHEFIHEQSAPMPASSESIEITVPSTRLEDNELRIWQILSDFEAEQQDDITRRYQVDVGGIDISAIAAAAHELDAPTIHKALTRVVITKVVELSLTGKAAAITTSEVLTSLNRIRGTQ